MKPLLPVAALWLALAANLQATPATAADGTHSPSSEVTAQAGPAPCTPPGVPTGLASTANGFEVRLDWTALAAGRCGARGYIVHAGSQPGTSDVAVVETRSPVLNATFPPGTYYVRVHAVNAGGVSGPSNEITVAVSGPCVAPSAPSNLQHSLNGFVATLTWVAPATGPAPTQYRVSIGSTPGTTLLTLVTGSTATQFQYTLPPGTYYARVKAVTACGESPASNEVVFSIAGCFVPSAPSNLQHSLNLNTTVATLTWVAPATGSAPTQYRVDIGLAPGMTNLTWLTGSTATAFQTFSFPPGTYYARVKAVTACGESPASNEVVFSVANGGCIVPSAPSNLQYSLNGNVATLTWVAPVTVPAPTEYRVDIGSTPGSTS